MEAERGSGGSIAQTPAVTSPNDFEASLLTLRERDVVRLLAQACSYTQIADRLGVTLQDVTGDIRSIYRKLGVRSATAAVMRATELRLLGQSD